MKYRSVKIYHALIIITPMFIFVAACSHIPENSGQLSAYDNLKYEKGVFAKYKVYSNQSALQSTTKVYLDPVKILPGAANAAPGANLDLVSNLIARRICLVAAKHYEIASHPGPDTAVIKTYITDFKPTGRSASAAKVVTHLRVPEGLGKLSAEAELISPQGQQMSAIVWSEQANVLSSGGLSRISDAYKFGGGFAKAFAATITIHGHPKAERVSTTASSQSNAVAQPCAIYGKTDDVEKVALFLSPVGSAPEWTDHGASPMTKTQTQ